MLFNEKLTKGKFVFTFKLISDWFVLSLGKTACHNATMGVNGVTFERRHLIKRISFPRIMYNFCERELNNYTKSENLKYQQMLPS